MNLYVYDPRQKWVEPFIEAARARGWQAQEVKDGWPGAPGYLLYLPHAHPTTLEQDKVRAEGLKVQPGIRWITDYEQVQVYEDKRAQICRWARFMPRTWLPNGLEAALSVVQHAPYPLVSKADVGASSVNVRILRNPQDAERHIRELWGKGVRVEHCDSQGSHSIQKGYAILQEFIPHQVTWRVNAIGRQRAVFKRYCYTDRPVAQTGNVDPTYSQADLPAGLMDFADEVFAAMRTQWCAVDVLWSENEMRWRLLETSLRWPWPSPGKCMEGRFFPSGRLWADLWPLLMDEIEAGVFDVP